MNTPTFYNTKRSRLMTVFGLLLYLLLVTGIDQAEAGFKGTSSHKLFTEKLTLFSKPPEGTLTFFESGVGNDSLTAVAYVAGNEAGMRVITNMKIGRLYDHIARGYPVIERRTETMAYLADKDDSYYATINDWRSPAYDGLCCLSFSPDGKQSAFLAQKEGAQFVVFNKHPLERYDMVDRRTGVLFSPDSSHAAYIASKNNKERVISDNKEHSPFDTITEIGYSPDSKKLSYIAVKDKEYYIVDDAKPSDPFDIAQGLLWSPQGHQLAVVAVKQDRWLIIKNGEKIDAGAYNINTFFDKKTNQYSTAVPMLTLPAFSPDSSGFAYVKTDGMRYQAVVNEKTGPAFDAVGNLRFSPDSTHFIYIGQTSYTAGTKSVVVFNGIAGSPYDEVINPGFSQNSKYLIYPARKKDKWCVVLNQIEGPLYETISNPFFSQDSKYMVYTARKKNQWCVVINQEEGKLYDEISPPLFSQDSKHLAYSARKKNQWCVVINQKEGRFYDEVSTPYFSPDSSKLVYRAKKNKKYFIVINGREQKAYDAIAHLVFSPDSSQFTYRAKEGDAWMVVHNQQEGKHYQPGPSGKIHITEPVFSPKGNHLVYMVYSTIDKTKFVVNNQESTSSFFYFSHVPIIFDTNNHLYTLVGRIENNQTHIYRLDIDIK